MPFHGIAPDNSWLGEGGERFFERLKNYMQNKNEGNENKVILGDLNWTLDKIDRDGENKTQRLYRWCSNYALWKLIVAWGSMEKGEPRFSRVLLLRQILCQESRIDRIYTDIYTDMKIANNTKIIHIMVSFTDHYNAISIDRLSSKTKIGKDSWNLIILFYVSPRSPQLQRLFFFIKNTKK